MFLKKLLYHQLRMSELPLVALVSYKHNVATKHWRSKLLTTNELWLLEM